MERKEWNSTSKEASSFSLESPLPSSQKQSVEHTEHQLLRMEKNPEAAESVPCLDIRKRPKTQRVSAKTQWHQAEATGVATW